VPTHKRLYDAAAINRATAASYDDLLDNLMSTQRVPAWAGSFMNRAMRLPKRYVIDPGLLGPLLRIDHRRVFRDSDLLGRVLDTLVAAQLRAECAVSVVGADMFHLRDATGRREIDLLCDCPGSAPDLLLLGFAARVWVRVSRGPDVAESERVRAAQRPEVTVVPVGRRNHQTAVSSAGRADGGAIT
jgi:hypothetical protein